MTTDGTLVISDEQARQWDDYVDASGWGDGLPTVVPTTERTEVLARTIDERYLHLPGIPPRRLRATADSLAANAVMAGCRPEHMPVVMAALEASLDPDYNLHGILATTHPCTTMVLVNGPVRQAAGVNSGANCLGQGTRANAVIGRAVHLFHTNIGGARPGVMDKATHGTPSKYSFCFAENEENSPWPPYHVRRGFTREQSAASVVAAESAHNVNDHGSTSGDEIATMIAGTMSESGSNQVYLMGGAHIVIIGPEHAATFHRDRWSVDDVQQCLYERSRVHVDRISAGNRATFVNRGKEPVNGYYYLGAGPEQIHVVVAGGPGKHSVWIPTFGSSSIASAEVLPAAS